MVAMLSAKIEKAISESKIVVLKKTVGQRFALAMSDLKLVMTGESHTEHIEWMIARVRKVYVDDTGRWVEIAL